MYEQLGNTTCFASFLISLATFSLQTELTPTDHYAEELAPKMNKIIQFDSSTSRTFVFAITKIKLADFFYIL